MPRIKRPLLMWSIVLAISDNRAGLRYVLQVTRQPIWAPCVRVAIAARSVHPSKWFPCGSPLSGKKWSQFPRVAQRDESKQTVEHERSEEHTSELQSLAYL